MTLLAVRALTKRFPGVVALDSVDLEVRPGEVHALMGQNGAGKSTLIKVLTGVYPRDSGSIALQGRPFRAASPADAQRHGIATVFQETSLVPTLSIAENLFLARPRAMGGAPRAWYGLDWPAAARRARELLARFDLRLDVHEALGRFPVAIQQMVAIARAVDMRARLLILDEPTSSLDARETARLFETMDRLKATGLGIIFVTHFLDQVYRVSDRITVLRNGRLVGTFDAPALDRVQLVAHMLGRSPADIAALGRRESPNAASPPRPEFSELLHAENLSRRDAIAPFTVTLRRAEVLGLAGLLGSGRTEAARLVFGADRPDTGSVRVGRRPLRPGSPRSAVRAGLGFCPEDRKAEGLFPDLSVIENIAIVALRTRPAPHDATQRLFRFGIVSRSAQLRLAEDLVRRLGISAASLHQPVKHLSGGNQQKVLLARWLAARSRILILDEPTRGIDVGAKAQIERLIDALAAGGAAILFISAELDEVARRCMGGRVLVLRDRRVVGDLTGDQITEPAIMHAIAGAPAGPGDAHA